MIDTHAHLNFPAFDDRRDTLIPDLLGSGISIINVGTNYQTSQDVIALAEKYDKGVYASIGLHPQNIESDFTLKKYGNLTGRESILEKDFNARGYKELANSRKVVAIGEAGLDYWTKPKGESKKREFKEKQKEIFNLQVSLSQELELPLIIHSRMAFEDTLEVLRSNKAKGVMHCFVGTLEEVDAYLELGYYIGLNGIIFKLDMDEAIKNIPLDRILLETDCPYLTPPGFVNEINNPFSLNIVAEKIASIKGVSLEKIADCSTKNATNLFKLS
ncbi:MAG: TatD family hydrolase [Minisyncoccus archaeiphilus]|uniref:TatD family hydrolase n=1 Tax=Minisyncoccus archaeiphilus TaxID=3238481 RepID=UPI002B1A6828|nr:MAG: TatD family hydrolase [Candidatus Parcubacteria bacterium]